MNKFKCPSHSCRVAMALLLAVALAAAGCQQKAETEARTAPVKLTLAVQPAPYSGLIALADEKGFFKQAGLDVTIKLYPSGLDSLRAMQGEEAQIATVADMAFASKMSKDPSLRIVASIGLSVGNQIVARKDRNIHEPSDLKGKRIGFSPNTASDYFLYTFLLTNHLSPDDVTLVSITPARQVEALAAGEVDAVSAFEIYAFTAKEQLGDNAVAWDTQNNLGYQWLLVARDISTKSPEAIKRLLKALVTAEDFTMTNEDETKSIICKKWGFSPAYMSQAWEQTRLDVSFSQSIIASLKNYAKWEMDREGKNGDPPDVLNFLYTDALDEINPRLVTIFR
ncbi:MAG: NrtA/SsuA/CpmA family ABC transporter substrate-binding protein [Syntrophobacteraceae bacterium]